MKIYPTGGGVDTHHRGERKNKRCFGIGDFSFTGTSAGVFLFSKHLSSELVNDKHLVQPIVEDDGFRICNI